MTDLATLYRMLDGPMDNKQPPQWAIDEAQSIFGKIEFDGYIYGTAYAIAKERERCAKICEEIMEGLDAYRWHGLIKIAAAKIRKL